MRSVLFVIVVALFVPGRVRAATLVLSGATVIDEAGRVTPDAVIIIRSGTPATVLKRANALLPNAARVIDVRGLWIVPGFVDNHVHVSWTTPAPEVWSRAGVTTVVDNGSNTAPAELRKQFESGPRVAACGPIITATAGYPAVVERDAPALEVANAADAATRTAEFIAREHPDCIKIAIERGFLVDLDEDGLPALSSAEVKAIVRVAHLHHLRVRAHVSQHLEFALAVNAGVDVIAHSPIDRIPEPVLKAAARRGVVIVSTVAIWADDRLRLAAIQNLVRYSQLGGPIAIGTDYPNWKTAGLPITEVNLLHAAGMTNKALLVALTRDTSHTRPPLRDFVVLGANPLQSLDALRDVRIVVRDGRVLFEKNRP